MELIEEDFLKFVTKCNAVKFGQFQLKDGSSSDIFFNSAAFDTGLKIKSLARFFAHKIQALSPNCKLIYGSAYKGIPLATAVAMELSHITGDEWVECMKLHAQGACDFPDPPSNPTEANHAQPFAS